MEASFYSNGKLLITGEYLVLDGAKALALPTRYGQHLIVSDQTNPILHWQSFDANKELWFEARMDISKNGRWISLSTGPLDTITKTLLQILNTALELNPEFSSFALNKKVTTLLDFPRNWGLGTSSTLINNIASWAKVDPFLLLENSFGGSGYDIACASATKAIIYRRENPPIITPLELPWNFTQELYFVYLGSKMDSKKGIERYRSQTKPSAPVFKKINEITTQIANTKEITEFEALLCEHEAIVSKVLDLPTIKERFFPEYPRAIKSLGAWGGDFILVAAEPDQLAYFTQKGYAPILPFSKMF